MRAARILLTVTFAILIVQGLGQMTHLRFDWPAHAHSHNLRGALAIVGIGIAGIVLVPRVLQTKWGWWTLALMLLMMVGGWWVTYALIDFGLDRELRVALPLFAILSVTSGAGLVLSWPGRTQV